MSKALFGFPIARMPGLRKILFLSPDSVEAHLALGTLLLQNQKNVDAAAEFRQVLVV